MGMAAVAGSALSRAHTVNPSHLGHADVSSTRSGGSAAATRRASRPLVTGRTSYPACKRKLDDPEIFRNVVNGENLAEHAY